jgi:hypothetical protein
MLAGSGTGAVTGTPVGAATSPVLPLVPPISVAKNSELPFLMKLAGVMPPATVTSKLRGPERFDGLVPFPQLVQSIEYSRFHRRELSCLTRCWLP